VEVGKDQINDGAEDAPGRTDHTEDRQSARDVFRLEPEPGANGGGQAKEWQPNIVIIEASSDLDPRQRLESVWFENFQVTRVTEKSKRRKTVERRNEPQDCKNEAKQSAGQGEAAIYRREYDVERSRENDGADAVSNEADQRETELRLVRENIARGVDGIARDDERAEQYVVAENNEGEPEQARDSRDFCGGPLCVVDLVSCHFCGPLFDGDYDFSVG